MKEIVGLPQDPGADELQECGHSDMVSFTVFVLNWLDIHDNLYQWNTKSRYPLFIVAIVDIARDKLETQIEIKIS